MRVAAITHDSVTEGPGLRTVIWLQGCNKKCLGCHNPETWDYNSGINYSVEELQKEIDSCNQAITFCGGEPLDQATDLIKVLSKYHGNVNGKEIWCYTGYTFEELIKNKNSDMWKLLPYLDVLVEGRFELENKSDSCLYRGSTNQRLLDAEASYYAEVPVEIDLN